MMEDTLVSRTYTDQHAEAGSAVIWTWNAIWSATERTCEGYEKEISICLFSEAASVLCTGKQQAQPEYGFSLHPIWLHHPH